MAIPKEYFLKNPKDGRILKKNVNGRYFYITQYIECYKKNIPFVFFEPNRYTKVNKHKDVLTSIKKIEIDKITDEGYIHYHIIFCKKNIDFIKNYTTGWGPEKDVIIKYQRKEKIKQLINNIHI